MQEKKISIQQMMILVFFTILAASTRSVPIASSAHGGKAGYIVPLLMLIPTLLLMLIINATMQKYPGKSLFDVYRDIGGVIAEKIVLVLVLISAMMITVVFTEFFSERFTSSILPNTPQEFFHVTLLALAFTSLNRGVAFLARCAETMFRMFLIIFVIIFFLTMFKIKPEYLFPLTLYDLPKASMAVPQLMMQFGFITFAAFMADRLNNSDGKLYQGIFVKSAAKYLLGASILASVMVAIVIGIYGAQSVELFTSPFFSALKVIDLFGAIERFETIFFAFWVAIDFIFVSFTIFTATTALKRLVSIQDDKLLAMPLLFTLFILTQCFTKNRFELDIATKQIVPFYMVPVLFGIPLVFWIIGLIRRKI